MGEARSRVAPPVGTAEAARLVAAAAADPVPEASPDLETAAVAAPEAAATEEAAKVADVREADPEVEAAVVLAVPFCKS